MDKVAIGFLFVLVVSVCSALVPMINNVNP